MSLFCVVSTFPLSHFSSSRETGFMSYFCATVNTTLDRNNWKAVFWLTAFKVFSPSCWGTHDGAALFTACVRDQSDYGRPSQREGSQKHGLSIFEKYSLIRSISISEIPLYKVLTAYLNSDTLKGQALILEPVGYNSDANQDYQVVSCISFMK